MRGTLFHIVICIPCCAQGRVLTLPCVSIYYSLKVKEGFCMLRRVFLYCLRGWKKSVTLLVMCAVLFSVLLALFPHPPRRFFRR